MKHNSNFLNRLWRSSRRTPPAKRGPRRTRLELERLDPREVPAAVADFGIDGLWRHTPTGGWIQLTTANPEDIATAANGNVVVGDFGTGGLWQWTSTSGWSMLTSADPQSIDVADDTTVVGAFALGGLWRWNPASGWRQLSPFDADNAVVSDNGSYLLGDFGLGGLWSYSVNTDLWRQVSSLNAVDIGIANDGTSFALGGGYVWRYTASGATRFDNGSSIPYWISVTGDGTLYAGYISAFYGTWQSVWRWTPTRQWTYLSGGFTPFTGVNAGAGVDANSVYVDYGAYGEPESQGLWYHSTISGWTRVRHTAEQVAAG